MALGTCMRVGGLKRTFILLARHVHGPIALPGPWLIIHVLGNDLIAPVLQRLDGERTWRLAGRLAGRPILIAQKLLEQDRRFGDSVESL